jgi:hypothetical protein
VKVFSRILTLVCHEIGMARKKRFEARIVEALADVTPVAGKLLPRHLGLPPVVQRRRAVVLPPCFQHDNVLYKTVQSLGKFIAWLVRSGSVA